MIIEPSHRLDHIKTYYFARKLAEIREIEAGGRSIINLGIGSPDLAPETGVIDSLYAAAQMPNANKYQSYKGTLELRTAFAECNKRHFGVDINPDKEVLPLLGSKEGIMHISMSYLNAGDEVLVPNPGYPAYSACAKIAGATVRHFELKESLGWQPDLEALAKEDLSKVKLMWVNYPNMPTGAKVDLEFFKSLLAFGESHGIMICHDNPYTFLLNDNPLSILQAKDMSNNYLELQSLSKNFNMAGWRVGALLAGEEIINTVMKFKSNMDSGMYYPVQQAAVTALSAGQDWFEKQNNVYTERKSIVFQIMDALGCQYEKDSSGLFVWALIPSGEKSGEQFADKILAQANVFITPGFIFGDAGDRYIRASLCAPLETLRQALSQIKKTFE